MIPPLDISAVIKRQNKIILKYLWYRALKEKYNWDKKDLRVTMLEDLANELIIQLIHIRTLPTVHNDNWWDINFPWNKGEVQKKQYRQRYYNGIRWALFVLFCGMLESNLRKLNNCVGEKSLKPMKYSHIYKKLLQNTGLLQFEELFKFANLVRNLVHNDFVFMPPDWKEDSVIFRWEKIIFIPNKVFNNFNIDKALDIYEDIYDALVAIITSNKSLEKKFIWRLN